MAESAVQAVVAAHVAIAEIVRADTGVVSKAIRREVQAAASSLSSVVDSVVVVAPHQLRLRGARWDGGTMALPMRREIRWLATGRTMRQQRPLLAVGSSVATAMEEAFRECYLTWLPANV